MQEDRESDKKVLADVLKTLEEMKKGRSP